MIPSLAQDYGRRCKVWPVMEVARSLPTGWWRWLQVFFYPGERHWPNRAAPDPARHSASSSVVDPWKPGPRNWHSPDVPVLTQGLFAGRISARRGACGPRQHPGSLVPGKAIIRRMGKYVSLNYELILVQPDAGVSLRFYWSRIRWGTLSTLTTFRAKASRLKSRLSTQARRIHRC